jgi:ParB family chromosome partitioning protein
MTKTATPPAAPQTLLLPVGAVHPDPQNPRSHLGDLTDLGASIREMGLLEPIVVRPHPDLPDEWMIVAGHRRHAAAAKAGVLFLPAVSRPDLVGADALAAMLVENLQRDALEPLDEAAAYATLVELGWKQKQIATRVSRSPAHISKRIRLLDLAEPIAAKVRIGDITVDTAYTLAKALNLGDSTGLLAGVVEELDRPRHQWDSPLDEIVRVMADAHTEGAANAAARRKVHDALIAEGRQELRDENMRGGDGWSKARQVEGWGGLEVDYDAHLDDECSRFRLVNRGGGWVPEYWCADPARHQPDGASPVKLTDATAKKEASRAKAEAAQAEGDRLRREARDLRHDFYRTSVARSTHTRDEGGLPVDQLGVLHYNTLALVHTFNGQDLDLVAAILDLPDWRPFHSHAVRQARICGEFEAHPVRTATAISLAHAEFAAAYPFGSLEHVDFRLQYLERLGWGGVQGSLDDGAHQ